METPQDESAVGTPLLQDSHKPRLRRLEQVFSDRPLCFVTAYVEGRRAILANQPVFDAFQEFCFIGWSEDISLDASYSCQITSISSSLFLETSLMRFPGG